MIKSRKRRKDQVRKTRKRSKRRKRRERERSQSRRKRGEERDTERGREREIEREQEKGERERERERHVRPGIFVTFPRRITISLGSSDCGGATGTPGAFSTNCGTGRNSWHGDIGLHRRKVMRQTSCRAPNVAENLLTDDAP